MQAQHRTWWKIDGATLAFWIAVLFEVASVAHYELGLYGYNIDYPPGFLDFFAWVALCAAAALRRWMLVWVALWLPPLALVSIEWLGPTLPKDSFGFFPWGNIMLFCGIALTIAATGTMSILRAARER